MNKNSWGVVAACRYSIILCLIFIYSITPSYSKIEININEGIYEDLPVEIAEFEGDNLD